MKLTATEYDQVDRIEQALLKSGDMIPSVAARVARVRTWKARHLLDWMVEQQFAHSTGNGARRHYHPGRDAEYGRYLVAMEREDAGRAAARA